MKLYSIFLVSISALSLFLFWPESDELPAKEFANALKTNKEAYLIDLRPIDQFSAGHIPGAMNISWMRPTFRARMAELDTARSVYVYCNTGEFNELVLSYLKLKGFVSYKSLKDGIQSWKAEKMIVTPPEILPPDELYFESFSRLLDMEHLVIVDFYLPWDTECHKTEPVIDAIAVDDRKTVKILRINVDKYKHLATEMGIETVPFIQFYENGNLTGEIEGAASRKEIELKLRLKDYINDRNYTLSINSRSEMSKAL